MIREPDPRRFAATLGIVDRPHFPPPTEPKRASFKEWFHFNVLDPTGACDVIVNLSLAGDVTRAGGGRADVIALVHRDGWWGDIASFDATAARAHPNRLALRVAGAAALDYAQQAYALHAEVPGLRLRLALRPLAEPMLLWNDTPLGSGHLNWLIAPHLAADATVELPGETVDLHDALGYHDHNWGFWRWGDDFGWEWGFGAQMQRPFGSGRWCLVFDRTTDRHGAASHEHTLALWRDEGLAKVFTRRQLRARRAGRFAGPVPRRPGAAQLVADGAVLTVPARLQASARDDAEGDWLDFEYTVHAALQIGVPSENGFGLVGLNETFGTLAVQGRVRGEPIAFDSRACFEFLG